MVASGFAIALLDSAIMAVQQLEISASFRSHPTDTLFIVHHHDFVPYLGLLGLWVAAVGLMWHSARRRAAGMS